MTEPDDGSPPEPDKSDKRLEPRLPVLKGAKLVFGGSVLDCVVLNISPQGARISVEAAYPLPEQLALHLRGGAVYSARRRWARGRDIGLQFIGAPLLSATSAQAAWSLYEALRNTAPDRVLAQLQDLRCFDDPALSVLVQKLEQAHSALAAALRQRAARAGT